MSKHKRIKHMKNNRRDKTRENKKRDKVLRKLRQQKEMFLDMMLEPKKEFSKLPIDSLENTVL